MSPSTAVRMQTGFKLPGKMALGHKHAFMTDPFNTGGAKRAAELWLEHRKNQAAMRDHLTSRPLAHLDNGANDADCSARL
jgi:hypothetical protein